MKKIKFIIFFILILIFPIIFLISGINIQYFKSPYFSTEELYLKLDKKLILRLKNLQIHKNSKSENSIKQINKIFSNLKWINVLFQEIILDHIEYQNTRAAFVFSNDTFTLDTNYLAINTNLNEHKAQIEHFELKDFNMTFSGNIEADFKKNRIDFDGQFSSFELNGNIKANMHRHYFYFDINNIKTEKIYDFVENIATKLELNQEVKKWINEYVKADYYELFGLWGSIDLKTNKIVSLNANASIKNAKVYFNKALPNAFVEAIDISLRNGNLNFKFFSPSYQNKSLDGSKLVITNIIEGNKHIILDLISQQISLNDAKPILQAYKINTNPISSQSSLNSNLHLDIALNPFKITANGNFKGVNSNVKISNSTFKVKNINLELNDKKLNFKNANLNSDFVDIDFNGYVDFHTHLGVFDTKIKKFKLANLIDIKNLKTKIDINTKNSFEIRIADLSFNGNFGKTNSLAIYDIKKILPYSSFFQKKLNVTSGFFNFISDDFYTFKGQAQAKFNMNLKDKQNKAYNNDIFYFAGNIDDYKITTKSKHVDILAKKNQNMQINLTQLIIPIASDNAQISQDDRNFTIDFNVKDSKVLLVDFNRSYEFTNFKASVGKNFDFVAQKEHRKIQAHKSDKKIKITAQNISENFVNALVGSNIFKGGNFDLQLSGSDFSNFIARIEAKETYLTSYSNQQNLLSLFDAIPSLISFKVPDFTNDGFHAQKATLLLERDNHLVDFKALAINGQTADIYGKGKIDLNKNNIDAQIEIVLLKSYSSIISKIPIINYIILGKDNRVSTIIDIFGTLDNPEYATHIAKDILSTPYNLIKNTLTLPLSIFGN